ncbi:unnamed protein product [Arabidopsis arenosa]|uniref:Uncharacterized protein n=1 Tax=Arabidopsis arenosa TaxID=38785 RepID=A0A8S2A764_ARAAE|nr:unnamed protein product [Arabidopsis arenosa]
MIESRVILLAKLLPSVKLTLRDAARLRPLLPQSTLRKRQVQLLTLESIQFLGGLNQVGADHSSQTEDNNNPRNYNPPGEKSASVCRSSSGEVESSGGVFAFAFHDSATIESDPRALKEEYELAGLSHLGLVGRRNNRSNLLHFMPLIERRCPFSPIAIPEGYPFRRSPGISGIRAVGLELTRIPWDQKEELSTGTGETLLTLKKEVFPGRSLWESAQKDELSDSFGKALTTKPESKKSYGITWTLPRSLPSLSMGPAPYEQIASKGFVSNLFKGTINFSVFTWNLCTMSALQLFFEYCGAPFRVVDCWRQSPLSPYIKGILVEMLKRKLKPKRLQLPPQDVVFEGEAAMNEYTFYRNWVESWLQHIRSYYLLFIDGDPSLSKFFEIEICAHSWKRSTFDQQVFKFGLLWECVDIARSRTVYWQCALGTGHIQEDKVSEATSPFTDDSSSRPRARSLYWHCNRSSKSAGNPVAYWLLPISLFGQTFDSITEPKKILPLVLLITFSYWAASIESGLTVLRDFQHKQ